MAFLDLVAIRLLCHLTIRPVLSVVNEGALHIYKAVGVQWRVQGNNTSGKGKCVFHQDGTHAQLPVNQL